MVDLKGRVDRGIDGNCRASELLSDFKLVRPIVRRERMVNQMLCRTVIAVRCARYQDNWQIFSIGAADRIDSRKPTDTESDYRSGRPTCARVALGAVAAVQLIAAIDFAPVR